MAKTRYNSAELLLAAAAGVFDAGRTVTIKLINAATGALIPIDTDVCTASAGDSKTYLWSFSNITTQPTTFTQIIYIMTDDSTVPVERREIVDVMGWVSTVSTTVPADMCKVSAFVFRPDDKAGVTPNRLLSDYEKAYAEIQGTFYQSNSGKHFDTVRRKPYFDSTGETFWLLPQGASVKFFIKQLDINQTVTIPASSTTDLNTLLTV